MKLKYHARDGTIEVEGTPDELAHYTHEIEKRRMQKHVATLKDYEASAPLKLHLETSDIDHRERQLKDRIYQVSSKDIAEYLVQNERPDMRHQVKDLMRYFLGQTLNSKSQQTYYLNFFSKLKRAHDYIEKERDGKWSKEKVLGGDGNTYTVYSFITENKGS